jgi:hypothetical protein
MKSIDNSVGHLPQEDLAHRWSNAVVHDATHDATIRTPEQAALISGNRAQHGVVRKEIKLRSFVN